MRKRPSLSVSVATALRAGAEARGFLAYVPYLFIACAAVAASAAFMTPVEFWSDDRWDISTAVFAGLLAFNGLLMALGWFAFGKIYEILTKDSLGKMLAKHDLLGLHLAFIDVSQAALVVASLTSVLGLVSVLLVLPPWADKLVFAMCLTFTGYAIIRALAATKMMNDLVWEQSQVRDAPTVSIVGGAR